MAVSSVVKNLTDTTILINDATPSTPKGYTAVIEVGNFAENRPKAERVTIYDRKDIVGARTTKDVVGTITWSQHLTEFTNATSVTVMDVIDAAGTWSDMASVAGPEYELEGNLVTVTVTKRGTFHDDAADHVTVYNKVHLEYQWSESEADTIDITGTVYGTVTRTGQVS